MFAVKSNKNQKHLSRLSGLRCKSYKSFIMRRFNSLCLAVHNVFSLDSVLFCRLTTCFFMFQTLPNFQSSPSSFQIHNDRLCSPHRNRGVEKWTRSLFSPKANKCLFDQLTMVTTALSLPLRTSRLSGWQEHNWSAHFCFNKTQSFDRTQSVQVIISYLIFINENNLGVNSIQ